MKYHHMGIPTTKGKNVIIEPNSPSPGVLLAFIEDNGAPIEFLQIDREIAGEDI